MAPGAHCPSPRCRAPTLWGGGDGPGPHSGLGGSQCRTHQAASWPRCKAVTKWKVVCPHTRLTGEAGDADVCLCAGVEPRPSRGPSAQEAPRGTQR